MEKRILPMWLSWFSGTVRGRGARGRARGNWYLGRQGRLVQVGRVSARHRIAQISSLRLISPTSINFWLRSFCYLLLTRSREYSGCSYRRNHKTRGLWPYRYTTNATVVAHVNFPRCKLLDGLVPGCPTGRQTDNVLFNFIKTTFFRSGRYLWSAFCNEKIDR